MQCTGYCLYTAHPIPTLTLPPPPHTTLYPTPPSLHHTLMAMGIMYIVMWCISACKSI